MFKSIATWALLAVATVQAVPTPVESFDIELDAREIAPRAVQSGLANFERLNTSGLAISDIGYYGGLRWDNIGAVGANDGGALASIRPRSPPNVAAYGAISRLLGGNPSVTADFTGSKTKSFSVSSFYFGCVEVVSTGPVGCKVAVAGYDSNNMLLAYKASYYNPVNTKIGSVDNMQEFTLPSSFTGLSYIRFATVYVSLGIIGGASPLVDVGSTVIDDFRYTITT